MNIKIGGLIVLVEDNPCIAVSDESSAGVCVDHAGRALHPADGDHLLNTH